VGADADRIPNSASMFDESPGAPADVLDAAISDGFPRSVGSTASCEADVMLAPAKKRPPAVPFLS